MTIISYHYTLISEGVSSRETAGFTTSSQILLSKEVADTGLTAIPPRLATVSNSTTSLPESSTQHTMTLGDSKYATIEQSVVDIASQKIKMGKTPPNYDIEAASLTSKLNESACTSASQSSDGQGSKPYSQVLSDKYLAFGNAISKIDQRGRSLNRTPTCQNPFARGKRNAGEQMWDSAIELDPSPIAKRISRSKTFFEDPSDPSALLDDNFLEPCQHIPLCFNVSEVLDSVSVSSIGSTKRIHYPTRVATALQDSSPLCTVGERSSTRQLTCISPQSSASLLPTEIIQRVFYGLAPIDFNSARHVCRSWLISSLDEPLLKEMLERGGFSTKIRHDVASLHSFTSTYAGVSSEWLMSKSLARECALGPDWSGNGLTVCTESDLETLQPSAFVHAADIDFSEAAAYNLPERIAASLFTVSTCGRFLMVAIGCLVYVYQLSQTSFCVETKAGHQPSYMKPLTRIICPNRVLACSMDTSSSRNAIAILLDGRVGLVYDLTSLNLSETGSEFSISANQKNQDVQQNERMGSLSPSGHSSLITRSPFTYPRDCPAIIPLASPRITATEEISISGSNDNGARRILTEARAKVRSDDCRACCSQKTSIIDDLPIESGPRSLYRNLCSDDDPPRSVAICPQRRCVAFGCSSGIELHWVDALTGQDLNRWFPLTVPSDFLFFLPPRKSVDSAKKLRLISSAARPSEKPSIALRRLGFRSQNSPFWERCSWPHVLGYADDNCDPIGISTRLGRPKAANVAVGTRGYDGRLETDHFCAIPLSDGYHILFTDPSTGRLCLGSDAPVGGPTKLLRKIWFEGPEGQGSPNFYAGGSDLSCGVRVVAAYGDSVWLFTVPPDIFTANHCSNFGLSTSIWAKCQPQQKDQNTKWIDWWPHDGMHEWLGYSTNVMPVSRVQGVWPVKIRGQELGSCPAVVDLAISSGPHMVIWAFGSGGLAKVWKLDNGHPQSLAKVWVMQDGTIRQNDVEGDTEMSNNDSIPESVLPLLRHQTGTLDDTNYFRSFSDPIPIRAEYTPSRRHRTGYDTDGDVVMNDS